ncbi:hypothetical protein D3C72_1491000 [compost metagenome]
MPHIRMRGIEEKHVAALSASLVEDLAKTIQTSPDNFTFEHIQTRFFEKGQPCPGYPFIEVLWFPRSIEIQNVAAELITKAIKMLVSQDVAVVFTAVTPSSYYENGKPF